MTNEKIKMAERVYVRGVEVKESVVNWESNRGVKRTWGQGQGQSSSNIADYDVTRWWLPRIPILSPIPLSSNIPNPTTRILSQEITFTIRIDTERQTPAHVCGGTAVVALTLVEYRGTPLPPFAFCLARDCLVTLSLSWSSREAAGAIRATLAKRIKCAIAAKRNALNWRAEFSSYLWVETREIREINNLLESNQLLSLEVEQNIERVFTRWSHQISSTYLSCENDTGFQAMGAKHWQKYYLIAHRKLYIDEGVKEMNTRVVQEEVYPGRAATLKLTPLAGPWSTNQLACVASLHSLRRPPACLSSHTAPQLCLQPQTSLLQPRFSGFYNFPKVTTTHATLPSCSYLSSRGHGGAVVRLLTSHIGEPGSVPAGLLTDFRVWESRRTMPLVGGFSSGSPVSPALSFRRCPIHTSNHPPQLSSNSLVPRELDAANQKVVDTATVKAPLHHFVLVYSVVTACGQRINIPLAKHPEETHPVNSNARDVYNMRKKMGDLTVDLDSEVRMEQGGIKMERGGDVAEKIRRPMALPGTIPTCESPEGSHFLTVTSAKAVTQLRVTLPHLGVSQPPDTNISPTPTNRLACSPPTKAKRDQSPASSLRFLQVRIVPDDATSQLVFSALSRFPRPRILALLHRYLTSSSLALHYTTTERHSPVGSLYRILIAQMTLLLKTDLGTCYLTCRLMAEWKREYNALPFSLQPVLKAIKDENWCKLCSTRMQGLGKREIPEKSQRAAASSGTIPTRENPGANRPRSEPGSPCRYRSPGGRCRSRTDTGSSTHTQAHRTDVTDIRCGVAADLIVHFQLDVAGNKALQPCFHYDPLNRPAFPRARPTAANLAPSSLHSLPTYRSALTYLSAEHCILLFTVPPPPPPKQPMAQSFNAPPIWGAESPGFKSRRLVIRHISLMDPLAKGYQRTPTIGRGGWVVRLLTSHQSEPGSIPGRVSPDLRKWKSCRTIPLPLHSGTVPFSPALSSSALMTSLLKAAQMFSLTLRTAAAHASKMASLASKKWDVSVLGTRPFVLYEYVYVDALRRLDSLETCSPFARPASREPPAESGSQSDTRPVSRTSRRQSMNGKVNKTTIATPLRLCVLLYSMLRRSTQSVLASGGKVDMTRLPQLGRERKQHIQPVLERSAEYLSALNIEVLTTTEEEAWGV
ncbi:hypothetical protein PR048_009053 [Dryococelus australis]|uniref:Uncharacterized protein n=1 Tax=Dryococelus australis TaxID=614101 RepID=A0ABQ9HZQ2_9NEOP|nr:hypothetical protein PR048_009053 [Dryococelus australis]